MPATPPFELDVRAGTGFELLVGLAALAGDEEVRPSWLPESVEACSAATRAAIDAVGRRSGELWLHLLGVALEQKAADAASLVAAVQRMRPAELRRHLVGVFVPAWRAVAGAETLESAAAGDAGAAARLLENDRYYAGRADALAVLLPLSAAETKRRVAAALTSFADEVLAPAEAAVRDALERDAAAKRALTQWLSPQELITTAAGGYRYEPEAGLDRVVLLPHLAAAPWLLLCQHESARIVCYAAEPEPVDPEQALVDRALLVARALADEQRVRIVRYLSAQDATAVELTQHLGLTKSTTHHHLAQLREAGLVELRGNARGYSYALVRDGLAEAVRALADLGR
jgi:DNA-binding transcriptional ArsR family regulator